MRGFPAGSSITASSSKGRVGVGRPTSRHGLTLLDSAGGEAGALLVSHLLGHVLAVPAAIKGNPARPAGQVDLDPEGVALDSLGCIAAFHPTSSGLRSVSCVLVDGRWAKATLPGAVLQAWLPGCSYVQARVADQGSLPFGPYSRPSLLQAPGPVLVEKGYRAVKDDLL